ncbi:hypothetical protein J4455_00800 [Candidatus Woesearchaeota archaeon]|nr:hypothetical protein [Candidatus Woesearchaeota archaeon]
MSIDTIKQNSEILNEAVIKFNSYTIEIDSLEKNLETTKDKKTKKVIEEQISSLKVKINELSTYILKIQINIQKLLDEELQYNAS